MEEELEDRGRMAPERKRPGVELVELVRSFLPATLNSSSRIVLERWFYVALARKRPGVGSFHQVPLGSSRQCQALEFRVLEALERLARNCKALERLARTFKALEGLAMKQLMRKLNISRGDHITYSNYCDQERALVQNVDYRAQTLTITEFSDGKMQRKTLEFSDLFNLLALDITGSVPSRDQGHIGQSLSHNTQSFKDPHRCNVQCAMCNYLLSNSCGHYVCNCESQSQINKRTTYDKYNRPIGPKRQSEKLHERTEKNKSQCKIANYNPQSNCVTCQLQSSTSKASLMPSSLQSTVQKHLALHSETCDQTKSDELLFEILCRALSQSLNNETHQIPSPTSKILLATFCLQSTVSKFNVIMISVEVSLLVRAAPHTVLQSRALLVAMFVAAAMLPYITLLVGNLTSVQRTYAGLWRPNELCDY